MDTTESTFGRHGHRRGCPGRFARASLSARLPTKSYPSGTEITFVSLYKNDFF